LNFLYKTKKWNLYVLLVFLALVIPFNHSSSTIDPVLIPQYISLALTCFLFMLISILNKDNLQILNSKYVLVILGYLSFVFISFFRITNLSEGLVETLKILLEFIFLAAVVDNVSENEESIDLITKAVVVSAFFAELEGIYQFRSLGSYSEIASITANMANKNLFASFLMLTLPFLFYGSLFFRSYWRFLSFISLILEVAFILLLRGRAVWVGLFLSGTICTIVLLLMLAKFKNSSVRVIGIVKKNRRKLFFTASLLILVSSVMVWLQRTKITGHNYFQLSTQNPLLNPHGRLDVWRNTLHMIGDHYLTGVGPGNWKIVFPEYGLNTITIAGNEGGSTADGSIIFQQPHNDILWVFAENGIGGIFFYLLLFIVPLIFAWKFVSGNSPLKDKALVFFLSGGILAYLINAFFDFPRERIEHQVLLMLIIGIILSKHLAKKNNPTGKFKHLLLVGLLVMVSFAGTEIGVIRLRADKHVLKAILAQHAGNWNRVIKEVNHADSFFYTLDPFATPILWYKGVAHFSLNQTDEAFTDFQKANELHPNHIHVLNNLGTCYGLKGNTDMAIRTYQKALNLSPGFSETLINMSALYFNSGKIDLAYATIRKCETDTVSEKYKHYFSTISKAYEKRNH